MKVPQGTFFDIPNLPIDYDCRGRTQCAECDRVILMEDALIVVKKTNGEDLIEHFCCEACANEFYLERLRRAGM